MPCLGSGTVLLVLSLGMSSSGSRAWVEWFPSAQTQPSPPRESILSVANHGPTSIRTSGQRGSRSGPRCLLGFVDWPRTSGGMRAPPLGFPLVLPLCPGSPWPAVGGIVFLSSWHILGDGRASPWSSAGRGLWAPSRQAGERVSAGWGEGAA